MNTMRKAGITLLALSLGVGNVAMAQGRDHDRGDRGDRGDRVERRGGPGFDPGRGPGTAMRPDGSSRWDGPGPRNDRDFGGYRGGPPAARPGGEWRSADDRRYDGHRDGRWRGPDRGWHGPEHGWRSNGPRGEWRGAGPRHDLYRGGYLPPMYRSHTYVVEDWRGHRLSPPPRGYHWVQAGGDYVLAAIATGVILSILLNN